MQNQEMMPHEENPDGRVSERDLLLTFIAERDVPCPACGYNLRQLTQPACPECGLTLKLSVGSDTPFKRVWAITLCLNAMIAGAGVFFLLISIAAGGPPLDEALEYFWYFAAMAWIPAPLIIFALRRWFCRQAHGVQRACVVLSVIWIIFLGLSLLATI